MSFCITDSAYHLAHLVKCRRGRDIKCVEIILRPYGTLSGVLFSSTDILSLTGRWKDINKFAA